MTAIAALKHKGKVYMGGDSAGVSGLSLDNVKQSKVFKNGKFILGYTTSFRMGQIIEHIFIPPKIKKNEDVFTYMVTKFVNELKKVFKKEDFGKDDVGGNFLVGYKNRIFSIEIDFTVLENYDNFNAVGCGHDLIKGCLYGIDGYDISPEKKIKKSLMAAEHFNGGVCGPFNIIHT